MPFEKGKSGYTKPPTQWLSGEAQTVTRQFPPALRQKFHCKNEEGQQFCLLVERLAMLPQSDLNSFYKFIDGLHEGN